MSGTPPFFPSLGTMPLIDGAIQQGRGVIGAVLGQTYNVQRLTSSVSGSITNSPPVATKFPARIRRTTKKVAIENAFFDLLIYEVKCDNRSLLLGDVFTETGYGNDGGIFTLVQKRPTRETLWMRTESAVTITRPMPAGGAAAQQPISGSTIAPGYGGVSKAGEWVMTLEDGLYDFTANAANPAVIPCGYQPLNRIRDGAANAAAGMLPTELYREHFVIYVPVLPGERISELDRLNFPNSDRYQVALLFTTEQTGLSGYICICEKLGT